MIRRLSLLTNILEKLKKLFGRKTFPDSASTVMSREFHYEYTDTIGLYFQKTIDFEQFQRGLVIRFIRLIGRVSFRTSDGWSIAYDAIIDTGCPITVIPRSHWEEIEHRVILPEASLGLAGGTVTGQLGEVTLRFRYNNDVSSPLTIKAHLLDGDERPLILGFEDILTDIRLVSDFAVDTAYLEFPRRMAE
jgi:hypothetical protein